MKKLPFTKDYLLKQYKKDVNTLLDDCDWIDYIENWRMCDIISGVGTKKGFEINSKQLLKLYNIKVKSLKLTSDQWREQYSDWNTGLPKIINMVYEILENNF